MRIGFGVFSSPVIPSTPMLLDPGQRSQQRRTASTRFSTLLGRTSISLDFLRSRSRANTSAGVIRVPYTCRLPSPDSRTLHRHFGIRQRRCSISRGDLRRGHASRCHGAASNCCGLPNRYVGPIVVDQGHARPGPGLETYCGKS